MNNKLIKIFDTTLRDGQQCPGAGMSFKNNIAYARLASQAGIDVLEAGFPAAGQLDYDIVRTIAEQCADEKHSATIAALCQLREEQVDTTIMALQPLISSQRARLHVYLPIDPNLMAVSLGQQAQDKPLLIQMVHDYIKKAVAAGLSVEFSPEGYSRMADNFDFVTDLFRAAITAGASVFNCPDTIGGACYLQGEEYFVAKMNKHARIIANEFPDNPISWSAHCHNDFGLALENSMHAVFNGPVTQIEACFNGIGERAGNVSLEQCVIYLKHFGALAHNKHHCFTQVNTAKIQQLSDFVDEHMLPRQPHWPITGNNAAKHSSGGHTNAILKNPLAYQPFDPREVGKEISFIFGPLSGGNHARSIIQAHGYRCEAHEKAEITQFIKQYYAQRRKGITEEELMQAYRIYRHPIRADHLGYTKQDKDSVLHFKGQFFDRGGSIDFNYHGADSVLAALNQAVTQHLPGVNVETYHSESAQQGAHATTKSKIIISVNKDQYFTGTAINQDIEISALNAYINAVNSAYVEQFCRIQEVC